MSWSSKSYGSGKDVKEVLWMSFPVEDNKAPQLRVVDFVSHGLAPDSLFTHRMLFLSYEHTWKHGHYGIEEPNESLSHRALSRLDSLASPRVLHLIELAFKLLYLFLLGSYVMTPPRKPVIVDDPPSLGFRGVCILLYTAASLIRRWSMSTLPSSLVFLSFVSHITAEPCPGDIAFDVLLLALIWHLLALHLPDSPSPLLVLSVSDSLPLAALFQRAVTHAIRPAVLFFLPIFFVSFYMLSLSLSDTFLRATASFTDPLPSAPIETRTSLLTLCLLVLVLFSASLCILTVTAASQGFSATQAIDPWDRFGTGVGRQARRSFFHAVHHHYSDRYYFPPPFNLLFIVVVQVPACAIWLASRGNARSCRARMEKIVWRATVGPFALLFAGTSLWGLWR
ncbi:hypothetical protein PUNSTDRAFT_123528 [Punctularia strigosozonata HHB-11173 SS5]|uniref:uncharacterized protein n=1 Tax=Punctularia strigosozonata (strain HHB-11173) TaxID=741275 RepID=UPI0004416A9F|nr:uncharacterized protein PUNSTDRAFT_123528 [Punctularia strigosozonata HHB-11173 SS5]EIN13548.1 hypothetical protein PUNSTDRAFT_123528 [Punctularia strigosozonata HHB-11173 SS5]